MSTSQRQSKLVSIYQHFIDNKLPVEANEDLNGYFTDLFCLTWSSQNRLALNKLFQSLDNHKIENDLKYNFNLFFNKSLKYFVDSNVNDVRKLNSLEHLILLSRTVIIKLKSSTKIMQVLTGNVHNDKVMMDLVIAIDNTLKLPSSNLLLIQKTLHLTLLFVCGINQGALGAFFQRKDLFNSLIKLISNPSTSSLTYESTLLIGVLANYHKSRAQNLNRYLRRVRDFVETDVMKKIILITSTGLENCINQYKDKLPNKSLTNSIMSFLQFNDYQDDSNISKFYFKDLPDKVTAILLPFFEFINANSIFSGLLCEDLLYNQQPNEPNGPLTLLSALSYIFTHSSSSFRGQSYATLGLYTLSALVEADECAEILLKSYNPSRNSNNSTLNSISQSPKSPSTNGISSPVTSNNSNDINNNNNNNNNNNSSRTDICRQRNRPLPLPKANRSPMESVLDCCTIYLRFNIPTFNEKSENFEYDVENCLIAVHTINRVLWHIQRLHVKLNYYWNELWETLTQTLELLIIHWNKIEDSQFKDNLMNDLAFVLVSSVRQSQSYLPNSTSYHYLLLPIVRMSTLTPNIINSLPKSQSLIALQATHINLKDSLTPAAKRSDPLAIRSFLSQSTNEVLNRVERDIKCDGIGEEPLKTFQKFDNNLSNSLNASLEIVCNDGLNIVPI